MQIAILSDIHGNSDALSCVLDEAKLLDIKSLLIAGDFVNYYYNVDKVLDLLSLWNFEAISGNHESLLSSWVNNDTREKIKKKYGSALGKTEKALTEKQINWLINLPEKKELIINNKSVLLCHGSPWDQDQYIYPDVEKNTIEKMFLENKDIIIYGHTHYPIIHKKNHQIIVNPGSVGQTRDKIPGACWAIWNTGTNTINLKRTPYNTERLIKQCQVNDPNLPYLQTVLTRTHAN